MTVFKKQQILQVRRLPFQALTYASQVTHKVGMNHFQWQLPSSFLFKQSLLARDSHMHVKFPAPSPAAVLTPPFECSLTL